MIDTEFTFFQCNANELSYNNLGRNTRSAVAPAKGFWAIGKE